jgi:hypothetical protein
MVSNDNLCCHQVHYLQLSSLTKSLRPRVVGLINKMFVHSDIKTKANNLVLCSVLNPDTCSDPPSMKSKGFLLDSARVIDL